MPGAPRSCGYAVESCRFDAGECHVVPPAMDLTARGRAPGAEEQLDQLPGGGGVFRGLVVAPAPGEPGEAHGQSGVVLDLAPGGGVVRGQSQLGAEDFEHQAWLEPDVRLLARVDPGG